MGCNLCNSNTNSLKSVSSRNDNAYNMHNINNPKNDYDSNYDNSNVISKLERCYITKSFNLENQNLKDLVFVEDFISKKRHSIDNKLNLNVFCVNFNNLKAIDDSLLSSIDVKIFSANNNFISVFPSIYHFKNLKKLDLSRNNISNIENDLNILTELQEINFSSNNIQKIPNLQNLKNLKEVDLSHNEIKILSKEILNLSSYTLLLNNNQIYEFDNIKEVSEKIINLDLSFNNLSNIPSILLLNSKIALLNLKGNKISYYELKKVDGFEQLMERRKIIKSNGFTNNLDVKFDVCGLEI